MDGLDPKNPGQFFRGYFPVSVHEDDERHLPIILHHEGLDCHVLVYTELSCCHLGTASLLIFVRTKGEVDLFILEDANGRRRWEMLSGHLMRCMLFPALRERVCLISGTLIRGS